MFGGEGSCGDDAAKTDQPEETPKTEDDENADEQKKADGGDSGVDAASGEKLTIGFATKGMFSPFFGKMEVAAKEYCQEKGIELVFQAPDVETNVTRQIEILENFIVSGVDAIVFAPCDDIMLNSTIKKANDAGIPVVLTNDTLNDEDLEAQGGSYYSYVGTAQYDAGKLGGEWLAKNFRKAARSRHSDWWKEFLPASTVSTDLWISCRTPLSMYLISPQMRSGPRPIT